MNPRRWYGWLRDRWDVLRSSYWFIPGLMTLVSGAAALTLIELERRIPLGFLERVPWLTAASAAGARSVLSTIAGSMMTVTSVVFSITIVALTLTSSQFGPRLLRTFLRDRASQLALGTFVATFFYSLLVLRAVESPERVPHLATAGAVGLAIVSLFVLIFYVHHAVSSLQAGSVIASVATEIDAQLPVLFPETIGEEPATFPVADDAERLAMLRTEGTPVVARSSGYVRVLDEDSLLGAAREHDLLIRVRTRPGGFVTAGSVLAVVAPGERADEEIADCIRDACVLGSHRTAVQDLCFLTDQLAEMAVRALSPGVNDPRTAVDCVQRLGVVVAALAARRMPSGLRADAEGAPRLVLDALDFDGVVASCFDPIRRHGAHDAQVAVALLEALAVARPRCRDPRRAELLAEHAREVRDGFVAADRAESKRDQERVEAAYERAISSSRS